MPDEYIHTCHYIGFGHRGWNSVLAMIFLTIATYLEPLNFHVNTLT